MASQYKLILPVSGISRATLSLAYKTLALPLSPPLFNPFLPPSPSMTRTRKLTLSVKEFSHLVSESLDIANAPQSLVENTAVFSEASQKPHPRQSSFQRIFSRPTPTLGQHEDSPHGAPEDLSDSPRKMIAWPFSRSPRKNRPTQDEDNALVRTIHYPTFVYLSNLALTGS